MRAAVLFLLASAAHAQPVLSHSRKSNLVTLSLGSGSAEIELLSLSTFRFLRCPGPSCPSRPARNDAVEFVLTETPSAVVLRTSYIELLVNRSNAAISARSLRGRELLRELPAERPASGVAFDFAAASGERYYGLGARTAAPLDLRGMSIESTRPFFISSAGFGLYFAAPGSYRWDLALPDRVTVRSPFTPYLEFFCYYGPTPKEILEEHHGVTGPIGPVDRAHTRLMPPSSLPRHATPVPRLNLADTIRYLNHASMSGVLAPSVDASALKHPLAALFPLLAGSKPGSVPLATRELRGRLEPYLFTYLKEARDRGIPIFHPMALQYPDDPNAVARSGQFMLGDELLVSASKELYLPQGTWTDLATNTVYKGRQVIYPQDSPEPRLFAHNGTIVPLLRPGGVIELHYLPRLGAEFFLAEDGEELHTQVHAAPAASYLRLEIEPRADHQFEWVVHHVSAPVKIEPNSAFRYDRARRNLHIPVKAPRDSDIIINVTLEEPLE